MHRPRRTAAVTLLVALAVLASGCGGSSGGTAAGSGTSTKLTGTITVLAASSLTESFTALGKAFEAQHPGTKVQFSFAASSELATQITGGAPADVFASASPATMQQVSDDGDAAATPKVFVRNTLEIAVPSGNPAGVTGLKDFANKELTIALCAPEVPCGAAATTVFKLAGITPHPDTLESDVKATLTKVTLGEVDAALVYKTDVKAAGSKVQGLDFPESAKAINDYPIVVLKDAPNPRTAAAFVALVESAHGRSVLSDAGFQVP
jgi:molybdate transport system substrate-binding protein